MSTINCVQSNRSNPAGWMLRTLFAMALGWPLITLAQTPESPAEDVNAASEHHAHTPPEIHQETTGEKLEPAKSETPAMKAKSGAQKPKEGMDHSKMKGMDHSQMEGMDHSQMEGMDHSKMEGMDHSKMEGMDHGDMDMQGGSAPADARNPDYSDGVSSGPMIGMDGMHGHSRLGSVLIDQLEQFTGDDENGQSLNAQAWVGSDLNKIWFKLEGERSDGRLETMRMELLWSKAISAYWNLQSGARHDSGSGPSRNWAAIGMQGLAPYWFEVDATAYVGEQGRTAFRLEAEYELLLTQRLVLQPDVEMNFYGKDDPARGIGAGFSDIELALRLRYEVTRKFAPYVGVVWSRKFGKTADYARADFGQVNDTQLVAGVRMWF